MGKKSSRQNKNIYLESREQSNLTRAQASELLEIVSESRIEKIESEKITAEPEDVLAMAKVYRKPELCNYYCANECAIGKETVPEIKISSLAEISLATLSALNALYKERDLLIDITADGTITNEELKDFASIMDHLEKISLTADTLRIWAQDAINNGTIDRSAYEREMKK